MKKRIHNRRGFTLTELLCATVVLVLATAMVVTCVQLATRSYSQSMRHSEARMLCSTLSSAVSEELRYAQDIRINSDNTLKDYFSSREGKHSSLNITDNGRLVIKSDESPTGTPLLGEMNYPMGLRAELEISYDAANTLFSAKLSVFQEDADDALAISEFGVEPLNVS